LKFPIPNRDHGTTTQAVNRGSRVFIYRACP
jgi:hypothetical protein